MKWTRDSNPDDLASVMFLRLHRCKWVPKDMDPMMLVQWGRILADIHRGRGSVEITDDGMFIDQEWTRP